MRKLKLLFPLLGTSALAVAPALTAQANQAKKSSAFGLNGLPDSLKRVETDNNSKMFVNGETDEYYYDLKQSFFYAHYTEANLTFTFNTYGATQLVKAKMASKSSTGSVIMSFLNDNLKHFDHLFWNSYIHEIENQSGDKLIGGTYNDPDIYSDFENSMDQPASTLDKLVTDYKNGDVLPQVSVRFHYNFHTFAKDDHDVSFTVGKFPPTSQSSLTIAPGKLTPATVFKGHFPGMGPYGNVGNQDHAKLISSESQSESLKLDLSTMSINYINSHFLNKPVPSSKIALGVMDYLWQAYPSRDWKATLAGFLRAGGVPAVNYYFGKLIDFIGTYQKDGKTLLKNTPAYYYIKDGDSFTAAKNQPFS